MKELTLAFGAKGMAILIPFLLAAAFLAYHKTIPAVRGGTRVLLTTLRVLALLLLILAILEPVAVFTNQEKSRPVVALLVDASRSMQIADAGAGGSEGSPASAAATRAAVAREIVRGDGLLASLERRYTVVPYLFGDGATSSADLDADIGARAEGTDIASAVAGARQAGAIDGVVIVTDGVRTSGADPVSAARELGRPVFAIGVGDPRPKKDLSVSSVLASDAVYAGTPSPVVATLRGHGMRGESIEVVLEEGGTVLARQTVTFPEGSEIAEARFTPVFEREGIHRPVVRVPAAPGEVTIENNARDFALKVLKKKIEVLLLFGRPEYDLAFLRRALVAEEGIAVDAWFSDREGRLHKGGGERTPPAGALTEETLFRYDAVVAGGLTPDLFRALPAALLRGYVERRAGSLVLLPGDAGFQALPRDLWAILPAAGPDAGGGGGASAGIAAGPLRAGLTLEGEHHPLTRLLPEVDANRTLWFGLPPLSGAALVGTPRPDADLLVSGARSPGEPGGPGSQPLLLLSNQDRARVLMVTGRGVWRWEFLTAGVGRSGEPVSRLWGNAVRWLVSRDEFKRTEVHPEEPSYSRGQRVRFLARVLDDAYTPVDDASLRVTLTRADDPNFSREISLSSSGSPGEYRGAVEDLAPGEYRYRGAAERSGIALGADDGEVVVTERSVEFEATAMDEATLRAMANVSGGKYVAAADYSEDALGVDLPETLREVKREIALWNHPMLYITIVGLFVAEWFLRKRRGLA
ncbi:MAG: hypothetical protein ACKVU1_03875 [bacterium]